MNISDGLTTKHHLKKNSEIWCPDSWEFREMLLTDMDCISSQYFRYKVNKYRNVDTGPVQEPEYFYTRGKTESSVIYWQQWYLHRQLRLARHREFCSWFTHFWFRLHPWPIHGNISCQECNTWNWNNTLKVTSLFELLIWLHQWALKTVEAMNQCSFNAV